MGTYLFNKDNKVSWKNLGTVGGRMSDRSYRAYYIKKITSFLYA